MITDNSFKAELAALNKKLISVVDAPAPLGLMAGKMGYCVYLYQAARTNKDVKYEKAASSLLDSVCSSLKQFQIWDIEKGLTGIGMGINFLVKENYVGGDINKILKEFDVLLLKLLLFPTPPIDSWLKFQLLYYCSVRIRDQKKGSDEEFVFKELIFKILNSVDQLPDNFFDEPYSFSIDYHFPFFLYTIGMLSELDVFRNKIKKLADEITQKVISLFPVLHSHRIYLVLGMSSLAERFNLPAWKTHIQLLKREINLNYMFECEFKNRKIFLKDGVAGAVLLLNAYNKMVEDKEKVIYNPEYVKERIRMSETWKQLLNDEVFFRNHSSLNGFCGISLLMTS